MSNSKYTATIQITRATDAEYNQYGDKVLKQATYDTLLEITVISASLDKLQKIVSAHVDLIEE